MQQKQSVKRFSVAFLFILCLSLLGFAYMAVSRADDSTALAKDSDGYYIIATSSDLVKFRDAVNSGSYDINGKLTADVDLSDVCSEALGSSWTPIGAWSLSARKKVYSGNFNGQGHAITGLYINRGGSDVYSQGLFGFVSGDSGMVRNLTVSGDVTGGYDTGMIAGENYHGTIENCISYGSVSSSANYAGGIVGDMNENARVISCTSNCASVTANSNAGGVVGGITCNSGKGAWIENCLANCQTVSASNYAGGIIGDSNAYDVTIRNCVANCKSVTATGKIAGGIAGRAARADVSNCAASCDSVSSGSFVAGLFGQIDSNDIIKDCVSTCGSITCTGKGDHAGALVGDTNEGSIISNCGWLENGMSVIVVSDQSVTKINVVSFDQSALDNGYIVAACLPSPTSLKLDEGAVGAVSFTTYPKTRTDTTACITSVTAAVDPSTLATAAYADHVLSVTGKTAGSGAISSKITITPTLFSDDCSRKTDPVVLKDNLVYLDISPSVPVISMDAVLPDGAVNEAYAAPLVLSKGGPTTKWSMTGNPSWLSVSGDTLTGTPTETGNYTLTLTAVNAAGTNSKDVTLKVAAQVTAPEITTADLSGSPAVAGQQYTLQLKADGTSATWSVVSGDLPDGVTLSEAGVLSGIPTTPGTYTFTVQATNSKGTSTQELTLTVKDAPAASGHGGSGGCNAGFGLLALLGATPLLLKKKR